MNAILLHTTKQHYLGVSQASFSGQLAFIRIQQHVHVREYHAHDRNDTIISIHICIIYNYIDMKSLNMKIPSLTLKTALEKP